MGTDQTRRGESKSLLQKLKDNIVSVAAIVAAVTALALAPIHFDERYAHAGDLRTMQEINRQQTQALKATVTQQQLNWLEYYNDKILVLERELARDPVRRDQLQREISDVKLRKQFLEKSLVDQSTSTNPSR
jgi:hypothetical protein